MRFARFLGRINTSVLLTLFYIFILGPLAIFFKLIGKDLLERKAEKRPSYWYNKSQTPNTIETAEHPF